MNLPSSNRSPLSYLRASLCATKLSEKDTCICSVEPIGEGPIPLQLDKGKPLRIRRNNFIDVHTLLYCVYVA